MAFPPKWYPLAYVAGAGLSPENPFCFCFLSVFSVFSSSSSRWVIDCGIEDCSSRLSLAHSFYVTGLRCVHFVNRGSTQDNRKGLFSWEGPAIVSAIAGSSSH